MKFENKAITVVGMVTIIREKFHQAIGLVSIPVAYALQICKAIVDQLLCNAVCCTGAKLWR